MCKWGNLTGYQGDKGLSNQGLCFKGGRNSKVKIQN